MPKLVTLVIVGILASSIAFPTEATQDTDPLAMGGVVIEEVREGSSLARAGIESGDVILAWRRLPSQPATLDEARGKVGSALDWMWLVVEQAPRGTVELTGLRSGRERVFVVVPGLWEAEVRPWMPVGLLEEYLRGKKDVEAGEIAAANSRWESVAAGAADWRLRCWLWLRIGDTWAKRREWAEAHAAYRLALEEVQEPHPRTLVWQSVGSAYEEQSEFDLAWQAFQSALNMRESAWPEEALGLAETLNQHGVVAWRRSDLDSADEFFQRALEIRQELAPNSLGVAQSLNGLGSVALRRGELEKATDMLKRALLIHNKLESTGLGMAKVLDGMGAVAITRGDLDEASRLLNHALEIRQEIVPGGLEVAQTLNKLGVLVWNRGDIKSAAEYFQRCYEIRQAIAPDSLEVSGSLNNLGAAYLRHGDRAKAMECYQRSLQIRQRLVPNSLEIAESLNSLAILAEDRGDFDVSIAYHRQALEIQQRIVPDSLDVADTLMNLGVAIKNRGNIDRAESLFQEAREVLGQLAPGSLNVAAILNNLGNVHHLRGDLARAGEFYQRTLEIRQDLLPGSYLVASSLNNLGVLARERGDLSGAMDLHLRALEIQQALAPGNISMANSLNNLGFVARDRGRLGEALSFHQRALEIRERLAPGSARLAATLHAIGVLQYQKNPAQKSAVKYLERALEVLEDQFSRLGGSRSIRGSFRAEYQGFYHDAMKVQLQSGDSATGFYTLERSRARSFLEYLTERDIIFSADIPGDLDRERRQFAERFDRTQHKLAKLNDRDDAELIEELRNKIRQMRDEASDIEDSIRRSSPRLAAEMYPLPLELEAARIALDPGTLMLSYSVGEESTVVFAVSKGGDLSVETLAITEPELRAQTEDLRRQIKAPGHPLSQRMRKFSALARDLYTILIEPMADQVESSERLLILADGPLHNLPWGSLLRDTPSGEAQYLVEFKPLHLALSATVFAELRKLRRREGDGPPSVQLVAFGNPHYPASRESATRHGDIVVRSVAERGSFDLEPLPHTGYEVEAISGVYPADRVRVYLGEEATEERAKSVGHDVGIVHFAAHGQVDQLFPLNSFLALSIPAEYREGEENGLLQAWEIFERVRVGADLVVLSACETALGQEQGGEGLIGLTQAFQYAGARSVAASLWSVADQTTAELMIRFYRHLRSGLPKDESLRGAQLEFIRSPLEVSDADGRKVSKDVSSPYYWAAFQIYGDWQ